MIGASQKGCAAPGAKKERLCSLDTLRGICILLMVAYHAAFDIALFGFFGGSPFLGFIERAFSSPLLSLLQSFFSGLFIFISGLSCRLSRSNFKRGAKLFAIACGLTAVTILSGTGVVILFGILHFLSAAMLLYALIDRFAARIFEKIPALLWLMLFFGAHILTKNVNPINAAEFSLFGMQLELPLFPFGFYSKSFASADYFPLLPWFFMFLFGASLGRRLPAASGAPAVWRLRLPIVTAAGRHTLWIYLIHQPVLLALMWAFDRLTG